LETRLTVPELGRMTDYETRVLAHNLRLRAAEILVKAEAMSDADAESQMRDVVARYLLLAQRLEDESA
jgi:hypothetical protein